TTAPLKQKSRVGTSMRELFRSGPAAFGAVMVVLFLLLAAFAPLLSPHNPREHHLVDRLKPPAWSEGGSPEYLLGTDQLGRDIFSRVLYGTRVALAVGAFGTGLALFIGVALG